MGKAVRRKKEKVPKLTEAEYARYVMTLRGETPPLKSEEQTQKIEREQNGQEMNKIF